MIGLLSELDLTPGDLNGDRSVNFADFLVLSLNFAKELKSYPEGDINVDGIVDFADFLILSTNFEGNEPSVATSTTTVPEPSGFVVLSIIALFCGLNQPHRLVARRAKPESEPTRQTGRQLNDGTSVD